MTTFTDSFTRANETPLVDPPWKLVTDPAFNLSGNVAVPSAFSGDCCAVYDVGTWADNQSSSAILSQDTNGAGGGGGIGLGVRHSLSAKTFIRLATDHFASNNCEISRFNAGVFTSLSVFTQAWVNGDRWELQAVGSIIIALLNGSIVKSLTDPSPLSGGNPAIAFSGQDGTTSTASVSNWIGTDQLGSPPFIPHRLPLGA